MKSGLADTTKSFSASVQNFPFANQFLMQIRKKEKYCKMEIVNRFV